MRDRKLTGPWAGFSFVRGQLVSPEGHEFAPEDLRWLSLTVGIKREWCRMMDDAKAEARERPPGILYIRDRLAKRQRAKPLPKPRQLVKVVVVDLDEYRRHFGYGAG